MSALSSLDLLALTQRVRAIRADPHAPVPSTGMPTLDQALAALAQHRRDEKPLSAGAPPFWLTVPAHADAQ